MHKVSLSRLNRAFMDASGLHRWYPSPSYLWTTGLLRYLSAAPPQDHRLVVFFLLQNIDLNNKNFFDVIDVLGGDPSPRPPMADCTLQISTYKLAFREAGQIHSRYTQKIPRFSNPQKNTKKFF